MSIIFDTLSRLETANPPMAGLSSNTSLSLRFDRFLSIRSLAVAAIIALATLGSALILWHQNSLLDGLAWFALGKPGSESEDSDELFHQTPVLPIDAHKPLKSTQVTPTPNTETTENQLATLMAYVSNGTLTKILEQPLEVTKGPIAPQDDKSIVDMVNGNPFITGGVIANSALVESNIEPKKTYKASPEAPPQTQSKAAASRNLNVVTAKPEPKNAFHHEQKQKSEIVPSGHVSVQNEVDRTIEKARLVLSRSQYSEALAILEALSPAPERRVDFWLIKGSAYLALGQLDSAEKALASAHSLAPANAQIAVQRAILQQERGNHSMALQILKEAARRNPNVPEIFLNQGYSEQALGAVRDARHSFRIFLRITEDRSLYAQQRNSVSQWLAQFSSASD